MTFKDKTLIVADLHLQSAEPGTLALAQSFLRSANGAKCLYILGDLFEFWLGDDCTPQALDDTVPVIVKALSELSESGTAITLMHGNRDFLLGDAFADRVGATLVQDDVIVLNESIVLMHGDTLCTDDIDYQRFRRQVRSSDWQSLFLAKKCDEREGIAAAMRSGSKESGNKKSLAIMDVNADAVDQLFADHQCRLLVHGHTHRPEVHQHDSGIRAVVGDWHADHAMVGMIDADGGIDLVRYTADS